MPDPDLSAIDQAASTAELSAEQLAAKAVTADAQATEAEPEGPEYPPVLEHMATGPAVRKLTNLLVYLGHASSPSTIGGETLDGEVLGDLDTARTALGITPPDPPEQVAESDWKALYEAAAAKMAGGAPQG